jgi:hypothetical protein
MINLFRKVPTILALLLIVVAMTASIYLYFRFVGLEVITTPGAFAIPVVEQLTTATADGKTRAVIEITPAPWPSEAKLIYRLARFGIPVQVVLKNEEAPGRFVIVGVDGAGHLVTVFDTKADANSVLHLLGYSGS